ncbi:MAG: RNA polymerase sigma factor [Fibrobacterota bacterium]|nr:sigma-70 family RNA polymerase sigma factor [Chitinispirillaceae bacterium]
MRDLFEKFVMEYQDMVFSTAMRITCNSAESEDISQQVFLQAYKQFNELQSHCNVGGWLRLAARNLSINHVKRYVKRWQFFDTVSDIPPEVEQGSDDEFLYDNTDKLKHELSGLPSKYRVPLVLFYYEGLAYYQIAEELKCSEGKIKTDIFRAKKMLKEKMESGANEQ